MTKIIKIENQVIQLNSSQLIQAGGEGMVFKVGQTAVKLYHQPKPSHQQKLDFFFNTSRYRQLPPEIIAPTCPVMDEQGNLLGFQMPLLPADAVPIKSLAKNAFWQKNRLSTTAVLTLFQQLHITLTTLHSLGIIVGDLNDQNVFISIDSQTARFAHYLIDTDSYQFGRFPCPVAMDLFVDPNLYGIPDLSKRPFFSPATDWYAYFVLLVRSLLHIHPYGGVHKQHKSIAARASTGISILQSDVIYPTNARPRESLPDDLLHNLHRVFDLGERPPFPLTLLTDYANNLVTCAQCQQEYPQQRPFCPFCSAKPTSRPTPISIDQPTHLHTTTGLIHSIHALPNGRFAAIIFEQNQYKLVRFGLGGVLDEIVLFNGNPGYQFAACQNILAVNPPGSRQILLLDVSGKQPRKLNLLETATFLETAVFAASPHHLYRIAGTWIMQGHMQNGHFVEEAIATAHRNQTWFHASPSSETIAGYHRIFAENRFFLWHSGKNFDIPIPPLQPGESLAETVVYFTLDSVIFSLTINQRGSTKTAVYHVSHRGKIQLQTSHPLLNNNLPSDTLHTLELPQGIINHTSHDIWYHPNK
jgi:serine/threonine protein kinase